jgi:hypothetical protein
MIAIGPVTKAPSWNWVGLDTAKELSKYFSIEIFNSYSILPKSKIILIVKQLPPVNFIEQAKSQDKKIIYCPIDYFENEMQLIKSDFILSKCDLILSHAESLIPLLDQFCPSFLVEHNSKFTLPKMTKYKPNGFVLWIGGFQFVPYICKYIKTFNPSYELKLLTDYKNKSAVGRAESLVRQIGIEINYKNLDLYDWSEDLQDKMMQECKAALDIKGDSFSQKHKPPTKGQKYITSGIPFAINSGNCCFSYFQRRNFDICEPKNVEKWFSEDYYNQTQKFGIELKKTLTDKAVGESYALFINDLVKTQSMKNDFNGINLELHWIENLEHNLPDYE